jgi:hypothetical protein
MKNNDPEIVVCAFYTMTTEAPVPDSIAIAFVVESSLAVAQDWRIITHDYCKAIMSRLIESHPGCRVCSQHNCGSTIRLKLASLA